MPLSQSKWRRQVFGRTGVMFPRCSSSIWAGCWLSPTKGAIGGRPIPLLFRYRNRNIPIADHAMVIALQKERSRLAFIAIQRSTRGTRDFHVVVDLDAVAGHSRVPTHEGNVEGGPFPELVAEISARGIVTVHRAHLMRRQGAAFGPHLDLIPAAQIDSAVAVLRAVDFDVQLEILPFLGGLDVGRAGPTLTLHHRVIVDQFSVARHPLAVLYVADGFPAGEVLPVEDGDRGGPRLGHGALQFWRAYGRDLRPDSFTALFDAAELVAGGGEVRSEE